MNRLIASTALALILTSPALADNHMATYMETAGAGDIYASDLIGMRVYATEAEVDADQAIAAGGEKEWDDIGEINDVVLGRDGSTKAVVLGVGGFLGIGEKDVALDMSSLKFVNEQDDPEDFFLVVNSSKVMLEEAPAFQRDMDMAETTEEPKAEDAEMAAVDRPMLVAPTVEREGYQTASVQDLTADTLQGMTVYGSKDESVGEIGQLIMSDDGEVKEAVIDVGGFLGIGEHNVAVTFDELSILREDGGNDVRVYIDSTQEQLEQLPEYEG